MIIDGHKKNEIIKQECCPFCAGVYACESERMLQELAGTLKQHSN